MAAASACCGIKRRSASGSRGRGDGGGGGRLRVVRSISSPHSPATLSCVTLVTQCDSDRLAQLCRTAAGWRAPGSCLSAAVLLRNTALATVLNRIRPLVEAATAMGCWMCIQLVVEQRQLRHGESANEGALYPINAMRNVALGAAQTELIMLIDVDQVPSNGLAASLAAGGTRLAEVLLSSRVAAVVPAFEPTTGTTDVAAVARTAERQSSLTVSQLRAWREEGSVQTFGVATYPRGHGSTDEAAWLALASLDECTPPVLDPRAWPTCKYTDGYEPYLIVRRVGVPPFDERYEGYGRNKIAWVRNLAALAFGFHACPYGFLLHQPHVPSVALEEFKKQARMQAVLELDRIGAAAVKSDPRGAIWCHAAEFLAADRRVNEWSRATRRTKTSRLTQLGRWRTFAAAAEAQKLLARQMEGSVHTTSTVRQQLGQLFELQHEYLDNLRAGATPLLVHLPHNSDGTVWAATHASLDYLPQLQRLLERWTGPVSIALVVAPSDMQAAARAAKLLAQKTTAPLIITAVTADWRAGSSEPGGAMYPSNLARQAAFEAVANSCSAWIWMLDADLSPCAGALERLQLQLKQVVDPTATVVVTPTFEAFTDAAFEQAVGENDIAKIRDMVLRALLGLFHAKNFSAGHAATDLSQWLRTVNLNHQRQNCSGPPAHYDITYELGFEPFALLHTDLAKRVAAESPRYPLFETSFRHPHRDKCAIYLRVAHAAKFIVVPDVCLLAPPHVPSTVHRSTASPDGDVFASTAGHARFAVYQEDLLRAVGSIFGTSESSGTDGDKLEATWRAKTDVWRLEDNVRIDGSVDGGSTDGVALVPFWHGWPVTGELNTLANVSIATDEQAAERVDAEGDSCCPSSCLSVRLVDGMIGVRTRLCLPSACDYEAGLAYQIKFPSGFPVADGRGGKLPGLTMGSDVLSSCFRWTADGRLSFSIAAAAPGTVKWTGCSSSEPAADAAFAAGATQCLWFGSVLVDTWMALTQEMVLNTANSDLVEVRAAVNGVLVTDAVVSTSSEHIVGSNSIRCLAEPTCWSTQPSDRLGSCESPGRTCVKLHIFASYPLGDISPYFKAKCSHASVAARHQQQHRVALEDLNETQHIVQEPTWIGLKCLTAMGTSLMKTIMVIGFHHSGTTLLRHMLGSHPQAHEIAAEVFPTPSELRVLRTQAADAGRQMLILKAPVNNLEDLVKASRMQQDLHVTFIYIRRNLPDVIFSIAKRLSCPVHELESEVAAWNAVESAEFTRTSKRIGAVVQLEELACNPGHVVRELSVALGIEFHPSMVSRPVDVLLSNQGKEPVTDHDRLRTRQVNGPIQPYQMHPWEKEDSETSDEGRCFLRGLDAQQH